MQEFDKAISRQYEIKIDSTIPFKDACLIETSKGRKIVKINRLSPERILFIHGVKEYLYKNGFIYIDRYLCTAQGMPYIIINKECFTVSDFIDGRACNFDNFQEINYISRLLAHMHKDLKGFIPPEGCLVHDDLGNLPYNFQKRIGELRRLKKLAENRKTEFDYLFMENVNYFYRRGEEALKKLSTSFYSELVKEARKDGVVCHHDFSHNNIIYFKNRFYLINFDNCCHELKSYDIVNLIRRKMRKCYWDINEATNILNQYRAVEAISDKEIEIIGVMLLFPQKFWRISNRYYNSKRSRRESNFYIRLKEVVDERGYHREFIEKFYQRFL